MNNVNLYYILLVVITLSIALIVTLILRKIINVFINKYSEKLKTDPTNFSFLKNSISFIIYSLAIIFIFFKIPYLKSIGTALFASAGILAVAVGFASQKAFTNIISGIFMLIFKPFKIGDIVELPDSREGIVEEITLRHTVIRNWESQRIIIPNSIISEETLINSSITDEKIRKQVLFGISYDSNIDKAIDIITEEALKHPLTIDKRTKQEKKNNDPVVVVRVVGLADFSVNLKAYIWTANYGDGFVLKCDLLKSVKERFDREGIEIPFPYRTVVFKKDLQDVKKD
ncbi:MAG: mechanosensitive ion channel family protein [Candidatus Delongbacteria bacterium]|nr:mechanosensitive ion channel family protein [Candidatus Delongbacteria bacterium]